MPNQIPAVIQSKGEAIGFAHENVFAYKGTFEDNGVFAYKRVFSFVSLCVKVNSAKTSLFTLI